MNLFSELKIHLEPMRFENSENTYYFGKGNKLYLIEQPNGCMIYAAYDRNLKPVIITELDDDKLLSMETPFESVYIVPSYKKLKKLVRVDDMFSLIPEIFFNVIDYGMLDDKRFKGVLFEKSLINVAIINSRGEIYETSMLVGDGVRGMDGNPHGTICGAYNLNPICGFGDRCLYFRPVITM